jgi:hypothetical protein
MDIETGAAIETLRFDIHNVDNELRRVEKTLTVKMDDLSGKFEALSGKLDGLDRKMEDLNGDTRRHIDVVTESLRDDIRIIAEGVVSLSAKVDALPR